MSRFQSAISEFSQLLEKARSPHLSPVDAMNQFHQWMGQLQLTMSLASQDLAAQLPQVRADGGDTLAVLQEFGRYQSGLAENLDRLSQILKGCDTLQSFEQAEPQLMETLASMQGLGQNLDQFLEEDEPPGVGPLPPLVRECLDCLDTGMGHLVEYTENRQRQSLLELAAQLEQAQNALQTFLASDD